MSTRASEGLNELSGDPRNAGIVKMELAQARAHIASGHWLGAITSRYIAAAWLILWLAPAPESQESRP